MKKVSRALQKLSKTKIGAYGIVRSFFCALVASAHWAPISQRAPIRKKRAGRFVFRVILSEPRVASRTFGRRAMRRASKSARPSADAGSENGNRNLAKRNVTFVSQDNENPFQIPSSLSLLGFVSARFTCLPETSTPLRSAQDDTENKTVTHNPVGADVLGGPQNRTPFYHRSASLPLGGYLPPRRGGPWSSRKTKRPSATVRLRFRKTLTQETMRSSTSPSSSHRAQKSRRRACRIRSQTDNKPSRA